MTLAVRVPGWAEGAAFTLNGAPVALDGVERGYARFRRLWREGDCLRMELALTPRLLQAHPAVEADAGRVALVRGPLVYCIEAADNPAPVHQLLLPADCCREVEHRPDLLGGVTVLKGVAYQPRATGDWLYAPVGDASRTDLRPVYLTAIPFYANANRGLVEMATWIRRA